MVYSALKNFFTALIAVIVLLLGSNTAFSSGFGIFTQDAAALGKGNAQVAHGDNPSAIFFNPALLTRLEGTHVRLGTTLIFPERKFTSDLDGGKHTTKNEIFYPSTFYFSHKASDRLALGLGFFSPFGLGTDWGETWEGRYLATKSEITTYNFNPSFSFQATSWLAVGGGVNLLFLDTTLESKSPVYIGGIQQPDAKQKLEGDGEGVGYNFGLLIDLPADFSIGASYRSEVSVDVSGDLTVSTPDPLPDSKHRARTTIDLPQVIHAAVSYSGFERLTLEAGLRWEGWSTYRSLEIKTPEGVQKEKKKWKDTFAFNLGAEYELSEIWTLRAGYIYGRNPVPDRTFEPSIPDADVHLFTLGTGISYNNFNFDLAYGYQRHESRRKDNQLGGESGQPADGRYESEIHVLGMSVGYAF